MYMTDKSLFAWKNTQMVNSCVHVPVLLLRIMVRTYIFMLDISVVLGFMLDISVWCWAVLKTMKENALLNSKEKLRIRILT